MKNGFDSVFVRLTHQGATLRYLPDFANYLFALTRILVFFRKGSHEGKREVIAKDLESPTSDAHGEQG